MFGSRLRVLGFGSGVAVCLMPGFVGASAVGGLGIFRASVDLFRGQVL